MGTKTKLELSANSVTVLERRYLARDDKGELAETPEGMFARVAQNIASAELLYNKDANVTALADQFFEVMSSLQFLPNSPTLMNAGRDLQQLSACFVLPVGDTMESIFETIKNTALIHKSGGGTGFAFSRLRPKDDRVLSTGGVASGPISFMRVFNAATDAVKQGGTRRGANMAILSVDHPDILEFITVKKDRTSLTNFNLSVAVTDKFMQAVIANDDYDLVNPRTGEVSSQLSARMVFDLIVDMAWDNGEPGIVFIDRMNDGNPTPSVGLIESTNPCGEQPLLPYEACNLGSINLSKMVRVIGGAREIDYQRLAYVVKLAVRFLDNVIDVNRYPLALIAEMTRANRKIGLGVMGFADLLIQLGIPYGSPEALSLGEELMHFISERGREASAQLAVERGAFPNFERSVYHERGLVPLRNATVTTIAPTGTLSIIANCSSGIEPVFSIAYFRNILDGDRLVEVHPMFEQMAKENGFYSEELIKSIAKEGTIRGEDRVPDWAQQVFVTAHDISPEWHVRMQSAFQKYTDNAVSKTVNLGHDATKDDVRDVLQFAYKEGCKGITLYRDGSRDMQVLTKGEANGTANGTSNGSANGKAVTAVAHQIVPRDRPHITHGCTEKMTTGCGTLYVTVNADEQGICEIFSQMGKSGGCAQAQSEAISRLVSLALRSGVDIDSIVRQLQGIRCPSIAWREGGVVLSCPDAIGKVLVARTKNGHTTNVANVAAKALEGKSLSVSAPRNMVGQCPDCSSLLEYLDGCYVCRACGYSKCG